MRRTLVAALALSLSGTSALAAGVSVPMDEVRTMTFAKPVTTVFVGNAAITVVVFGFAALALAATLYDVIALHQ